MSREDLNCPLDFLIKFQAFGWRLKGVLCLVEWSLHQLVCPTYVLSDTSLRIMSSPEETDGFDLSDDYNFPLNWLDVEAVPPSEERARDTIPLPTSNGQPPSSVQFENIMMLKKFLETFDLGSENEWCIVLPVHMITIIRAYLKSRRENNVWLVKRSQVQI